MKPIFKNSLLLRLGLAMTIIISLSFMSMLSSVFIAEETQGAAGAINGFGSLRMLSYKMATQLASTDRTSQSKVALMELVNQFDRRVEALGSFNMAMSALTVGMVDQSPQGDKFQGSPLHGIALTFYATRDNWRDT